MGIRQGMSLPLICTLKECVTTHTSHPVGQIFPDTNMPIKCGKTGLCLSPGFQKLPLWLIFQLCCEKCTHSQKIPH